MIAVEIDEIPEEYGFVETEADGDKPLIPQQQERHPVVIVPISVSAVSAQSLK